MRIRLVGDLRRFLIAAISPSSLYAADAVDIVRKNFKPFCAGGFFHLFKNISVTGSSSSRSLRAQFRSSVHYGFETSVFFGLMYLYGRNAASPVPPVPYSENRCKKIRRALRQQNLRAVPGIPGEIAYVFHAAYQQRVDVFFFCPPQGRLYSFVHILTRFSNILHKPSSWKAHPSP
jgi:hypothetical protein